MIGSIISAGADLVGGLLNQNAAEEASKKDWKRTKETLQNQIQWRVDDAVKAGLHPLVGAGISPSSGPPPSTVGDMGTSVSNMGNNLGRAVDAYMDPQAKIAAKAALLDLEQRQANIDLTRSQIAGAQKALLTQGSTPGVASDLPLAPTLPGGIVDVRNTDPNMNRRLQDRHGEMADVITAPQSVLELLSQPGNLTDPALASMIRNMGGGVLDFSRLFYGEDHPQSRKRNYNDWR